MLRRAPETPRTTQRLQRTSGSDRGLHRWKEQDGAKLFPLVQAFSPIYWKTCGLSTLGVLELSPIAPSTSATIMTDDIRPRSMPAAAVSWATTIRYLAAVCLLPAIVLWHQDNILFTGYGYIDPWLYFGYFRNLMEFKRSLLPGNTIGTYLSWILPGATVHKLFAPLAANCILHL